MPSGEVGGVQPKALPENLVNRIAASPHRTQLAKDSQSEMLSTLPPEVQCAVLNLSAATYTCEWHANLATVRGQEQDQNDPKLAKAKQILSESRQTIRNYERDHQIQIPELPPAPHPSDTESQQEQEETTAAADQTQTKTNHQTAEVDPETAAAISKLQEKGYLIKPLAAEQSTATDAAMPQAAEPEEPWVPSPETLRKQMEQKVQQKQHQDRQVARIQKNLGFTQAKFAKLWQQKAEALQRANALHDEICAITAQLHHSLNEGGADTMPAAAGTGSSGSNSELQQTSETPSSEGSAEQELQKLKSAISGVPGMGALLEKWGEAKGSLDEKAAWEATQEFGREVERIFQKHMQEAQQVQQPPEQVQPAAAERGALPDFTEEPKNEAKEEPSPTDPPNPEQPTAAAPTSPNPEQQPAAATPSPERVPTSPVPSSEEVEAPPSKRKKDMDGMLQDEATTASTAKGSCG
jgi:hypothetical protein